MSNVDKVWLVKSGTHILGPYDYDSVVVQLKDRTLSIRDEISKHLEHWLQISEVPAFAKVVEELRMSALIDGSDDDFNDDATAVNTVANFTITKESMSEGGASDQLAPLSEAHQPIVNKVNEVNTSYKANDTEAVNYEVSKAPKINAVIWLLALFFVGGLGFVIYKDSLRFDKQTLSAEQYFEDGQQDFKLGEYSDAHKKLSKSINLGSTNQKAFSLLTQSYLAMGMSVSARKVISNESFTDLSDYEKTNLQGLSFFKEGEVIVADKYFNQSLSANNSYAPALINSSLAAAQLGKIDIALMRLNKGMGSLSQYPEISFLYILRQIDLYMVKNEKNDLVKIQDFIKNNFSESFPFYQESQVVKAFVHARLGLKLDENDVASIIDNDPNEFTNLNFSTLIDETKISWKELLLICDEVASSFSEVTSTIVLSFCRYKDKKYRLASEVLAINLAKEPNNPLLLSLSALYSKKLGENKKYNKLLEQSLIENERLPSPIALPYILKLTDCVKSTDVSCMTTFSTKLLKARPNSLIAQAAMAEVAFKKKKYNESHLIVSKGLIQSSNYLPLKKKLVDLEPYVK